MSETSLAMEPTASGSQPKPSPPARDPGPTGDGNTAETGACRDDSKKAGAKQRKRVNRKRPDVPRVPAACEMDWSRGGVYTQEEKAEAWSKADGMVQEYSDEMIKRWKEEIDTYLVFAGLFSAVLTTFNVQTYVLLQPPAPDASMAVLLQISSQLASFSISPPFVNSTQLPSTNILDSNNAPPIPRWAIWLNALWFSGLILSLAAASIGILVKQWLNEYSSGLSGKSGAGASGSGISGTGTSRAVARVRQYRLENLRTWRVEDIVGTIPILLQLALAFFLAGMLILLWNLHHTVAAIASVLVGLLATFTIVATLLPLFNHTCSYLTPQIRALNALWQPKRFAYWTCAHVSAGFGAAARLFSSESPSSVLPVEPRLHPHFEYVRRQLTAWVVQPASTLFRRLEHAIRRREAWKERKQTWQGRERSAIVKIADDLDKKTLLEAYSTTLHPDALSAASVCLMDFDDDSVLDYFRNLHMSAREHFGHAADSHRGPLGLGNQQQMLWLQVLLCIVTGGDPPLSEEETTVLDVYFRSGDWSSSLKDRHAEWAIKTIDSFLDIESTGVRRIGFVTLDTLYNQRSALVRHVMNRTEPFITSMTPAVSGAYYRLRLEKLDRSQASSDDAAYMRYLERVDNFLEIAAIALKSSIPPTDLENIRAYMRDVLIELTGDLLDVFAQDRVRTTDAPVFILHVMGRFRALDDSTISHCISDDFVPDMLQLMDLFSTYSDYDYDFYVEVIQENARIFKDTLIRVKGDPGSRKSVTFETLPAAAPSEDTPSEVANPSGLSVRSSGGQTLPSSPTIPSAADSSHDGALTETPPVDLAA